MLVGISVRVFLVHCLQRKWYFYYGQFLWYILMAAIFWATMKSVSLCFHNFRQYPAMDIVTTYEPREAKFPKVTICQNSMHSRLLVQSKYDFMLKNLGLLYNSMEVDRESAEHLEALRQRLAKKQVHVSVQRIEKCFLIR